VASVTANDWLNLEDLKKTLWGFGLAASSLENVSAPPYSTISQVLPAYKSCKRALRHIGNAEYDPEFEMYVNDTRKMGHTMVSSVKCNFLYQTAHRYDKIKYARASTARIETHQRVYFKDISYQQAWQDKLKGRH
jgi:hypothetical protein